MTDTGKSSQQLIKEANMNLVFRLIHKNGAISRADIKKITSLSATTVSSLVEELIGEGFVEECGIKKTKSSGRKAVMLKVKADGGFFAGLDVKKNIIRADLYGLDFTLEKSIERSLSDGESLAMGIMQAIGTLSRNKKIIGVTIGLPGVIDPGTNSLISSTVLAADDVKDIYSILKEAMPDVDVYIKNNSGLIALAEKEFGNHGRADNLISVDINDGVGAGILVDGKIYEGSGMGGEFGHMSVDFGGRKCKCGSYGCLELYASVPEILSLTETSSLGELAEKLSFGQKKKEVLQVTRALAFGINNIVNLLDPEIIVIGGSVITLGEHFLDAIKESFREIALIKDKKIVYSDIKENPVTLGGVRFSFDRMFGF
ncbi:MAG: ROK family transcriptional regulator [Clostridia bacterium]|nr:ROK family transcriptional regulator [Clostridia bacterium]MBQ8759582.1 ROK family transcriptional regulator [Clostridia bacterium]